ncbi:YbaY family lipoprotein [Halomonas sp. MCCC 1A11062]|uniref:YbaY family lipoprotein n=1 Tax=Halomonas sp. MCCC 1A11062 TaxID=2733485 RepID=UPI001F447B92|nr:YbaY family lipoprotein [Halomonas sp. MCCC 1A11062]MCE8039413.1 hypothetical protein [Halomonas sp. MCCC 1A11062]
MVVARNSLLSAVRHHRIGIAALTLLMLAGCAGTPEFADLDVQVEPPGGVELAQDAELRVWLSDAGGTLAETRATPSGAGPWPAALRFDRRTLEAASSPRLAAELRQQGRITHITPKPAEMPAGGRGPVSLPLEPRP